MGLVNEPRMMAASTALSYYTSMPPASSCANFTEKECRGQQRTKFRGLCPETCGCADTWHGIFDLNGCTRNCDSHRARDVVRSALRLNCEDLSSDVLTRTLIWKKYWSEMQDFLGRHSMLQDLLAQLNVSDLVPAATDSGCEF